MELKNIKDMIYKFIMKWENGDEHACWTTLYIAYVVIFDFGTTVMLHLQLNNVRIDLHFEILSTKYEFHFAYKYWIGAIY